MLNTLPYERYILACCLNEPQAIWEISSTLEPKDFSYAANGYIFNACKELLANEQELDITSIYNFLDEPLKRAVDAADSVRNGLHYLDVIKNSPYSIQNLPENVKIVKSVSTRKQLISMCNDLANKLERGDGMLDPNEVIEGAVKQFVDSTLTEDDTFSSGQIGLGLRDAIVERMQNPVPIVGYKTGFPKFDAEIGGLQNGRLLVIAARPKVGKSTFLLNMAKFLAVDQQIPVLYLDTEMSTKEQQSRLLSMSSGVEEKKILNGLFIKSDKDKAAIEKYLPVIEEAPLYHIYMPDFTLEKVIALARKYKVQYNIGAVFFDYLKLPDGADLRNAAEWQHLGYFTTGLKNKIAGKLDIPVVTAGQFNRKQVSADNFETDQLAGSDRILHYANTLVGLRKKRPDEYDDENGRKGNVIMTIMASRNCEDDISFDLLFNRPKLQISEIGRRKDEHDFYALD